MNNRRDDIRRPPEPSTSRSDASAADALTIGVFTTDPDLVVTSWDASLERMTGIEASRARGQRLGTLVPDLEARGLDALAREPLASGTPQVLAPAIHKFLVPCAPLAPSTEFDRMQQRVVIAALREGDRAVGLVFSVEDVTPRLEAERKLARDLRDRDPAVRAAAIERLSRAEPLGGIEGLAEAISDEDWKVRRAAVRALAEKRDAALVDAMVSALREGHRNFSVLSSALQLLTMTGVDATEALVRLLSDPDHDLRLQAALALGSQHTPRAVQALLEALNDPDTNVRFHAIEALGKLSAPEAIAPLLAIAESDDVFLAFAAVDAMVRINEPSVAQRITPLLTKPLLAAPVAEALARIGDEDAVAPLAEALARPDLPAATVAVAIASIYQRYEDWLGGGAAIESLARAAITPAGAERIIEALPRASGADLRALVTVVGWLNHGAVQRGLALLLGHEGVHHAVVEALVRFGPAAIDLLMAQLQRDDADTRRAAVVALGRIGDRRAVPALLTLFDEDHRDLWVHAAGALARLGDQRAFEPLLALIGDRDAAVRQAAIGALNSIGHPAMAARIGELLDSPDATVRESAVRIAGYFGYAECLEALLEKCRDGEETVRAAALEHAAFLDDRRVPDLLARALAEDTPRVRAAAAHALARLDGPQVPALIQRTLEDEDAWVRYFGASSAGRRGDASLVPILERLATTDAAPQVRVAAVDALGALGGAAVVAIVAPLAAAENIDVARAALRALGRQADEQVPRPIAAALGSIDAARRSAAAEALAGATAASAVELLRDSASRDPDPHVAQAGLHSLAAIAATEGRAGEAAVAALVALAADPGPHEGAIAILARLPEPSIARIGGLLDASDPHTRHAAVSALGFMAQPSASSLLQRALDNPDAVVRQKAIVALGRLGTRTIVRQLSALARTDPSADVRQAASTALARRQAEDVGGPQP